MCILYGQAIDWPEWVASPLIGSEQYYSFVAQNFIDPAEVRRAGVVVEDAPRNPDVRSMSSVLPDRPVFALMAAKRTETRDEREARKEAKRAAQAEAALRAAQGAVPTITATAPEAGGGSRATEHEDGEHVGGGEDEEVREVADPHGLSEVDRARIFAEEQRAIAEEAYRRSQEADALVEQEEAKTRGSGAAEEKEAATVGSSTTSVQTSSSSNTLFSGQNYFLLIRKWTAEQI